MNDSKTTMFGGENTATSSTFSLYTGLAPLTLCAVNPSTEELAELLDRDITWTPNYELRENPHNGRMERPITFWVTSDLTKAYTPITFNLSLNTVTAANGKMRYIDKLGQSTYYVTDKQEIIDNAKVTWIDTDSLVPLRYGEENINNFMQRLVKYSPKNADADWRADLSKYNMTFDELYNNSLDGLKTFIEYTRDNEMQIVGLYVVTKKTVVSDEGVETFKHRQDILSNTDTFFSYYNKLDERMHNRLRTIVNKRIEQGLTLTTKLYTYKFQEFNEENCTNIEGAVPNETVSPATPTNTWLK